MSNPTKFCKDCKFVRKPWIEPISSARCGHPSAVHFDEDYLVGAKFSERRYCSSMRYYAERCGPDAKFWEPRK